MNGMIAKKYKVLLEADLPDIEVVRGLVYGSECVGKTMYNVNIAQVDGTIDRMNEFVLSNKVGISSDKVDAIKYAKDGNAGMVDWCSDNANRRLADIIVYTKALKVLERVKASLQQSGVQA